MELKEHVGNLSVDVLPQEHCRRVVHSSPVSFALHWAEHSFHHDVPCLRQHVSNSWPHLSGVDLDYFPGLELCALAIQSEHRVSKMDLSGGAGHQLFLLIDFVNKVVVSQHQGMLRPFDENVD